jgi:hypothetical protein
MASLNELAPWLKPYAVGLKEYFPDLTVTSVYRSYSQQLELYRNRKNNPYPVAPPGSSYHQYRRAFDMVGDRERLEWAGTIWKAWGGQWSASDPIHFQA